MTAIGTTSLYIILLWMIARVHVHLHSYDAPHARRCCIESSHTSVRLPHQCAFLSRPGFAESLVLALWRHTLSIQRSASGVVCEFIYTLLKGCLSSDQDQPAIRHCIGCGNIKTWAGSISYFPVFPLHQTASYSQLNKKSRCRTRSV